jgi:hypothetical protein
MTGRKKIQLPQRRNNYLEIQNNSIMFACDTFRFTCLIVFIPRGKVSWWNSCRLVLIQLSYFVECRNRAYGIRLLFLIYYSYENILHILKDLYLIWI